MGRDRRGGQWGNRPRARGVARGHQRGSTAGGVPEWAWTVEMPTNFPPREPFAAPTIAAASAAAADAAATNAAAAFRQTHRHSAAVAPLSPEQRGARFTASVAKHICGYGRRVLPSSVLCRARRESPPVPLVRCVRFCVPCNESGVPLQPEPIRSVELWCDLRHWGRVHVGNVPVPYDEHFRCAFPTIVQAILHRVPAGAAPPPTAYATGRAAAGTAAATAASSPPPSPGARHVVSLQLADEPLILDAVEAQLRTPSAYAAAQVGAALRR